MIYTFCSLWRIQPISWEIIQISNYLHKSFPCFLSEWAMISFYVQDIIYVFMLLLSGMLSVALRWVVLFFYNLKCSHGLFKNHIHFFDIMLCKTVISFLKPYLMSNSISQGNGRCQELWFQELISSTYSITDFL